MSGRHPIAARLLRYVLVLILFISIGAILQNVYADQASIANLLIVILGLAYVIYIILSSLFSFTGWLEANKPNTKDLVMLLILIAGCAICYHYTDRQHKEAMRDAVEKSREVVEYVNDISESKLGVSTASLGKLKPPPLPTIFVFEKGKIKPAPDLFTMPGSAATRTNASPATPLLAPSVPPLPLDLATLYKKSRLSVVAIKSYQSTGALSMLGSGFVIDPGTQIVTNFHVVQGASKVEINFHDGTVETVDEAAAVSPECDLAILNIKTNTLPFAASTKSFELGQKVIVIGNPKGLQQAVSQGAVSGIRATQNGEYYQVTASLSPTNTGGPVLTDEGDLLGMATYGIKDMTNMNLVVPMKNINQCLLQPNPVKLRDMGKNKGSASSCGVEILKLNITENTTATPLTRSMSFSLKNTTACTLKQILLRIVYYDQVAKSSPGKPLDENKKSSPVIVDYEDMILAGPIEQDMAKYYEIMPKSNAPGTPSLTVLDFSAK